MDATATENSRAVALRNAIDGWGTRPGWEQVWDETCAPEMVYRFCGWPEPAAVGREAAKSFEAALFVGFPGLEQTIQAMLAEEDQVAYRHTLRGTHTGPFMNAPPSGRRVEITGITWLRLDRDRIVEKHYELNHSELRRQLALIDHGM